MERFHVQMRHIQTSGLPGVLQWGMPGVLITRETAAAYGAKGRATFARERQAAKEQADLLARAVEAIRIATVQAQAAPQLVDYRSLRLVRVRAHLDRIDGLIEKENDPQSLSQLAQAADKFQEQERLLAGRPAPKAEESKRHQVRQGQKNSEQASADRAEPTEG